MQLCSGDMSKQRLHVHSVILQLKQGYMLCFSVILLEQCGVQRSQIHQCPVLKIKTQKSCLNVCLTKVQRSSVQRYRCCAGVYGIEETGGLGTCEWVYFWCKKHSQLFIASLDRRSGKSRKHENQRKDWGSGLVSTVKWMVKN